MRPPLDDVPVALRHRLGRRWRDAEQITDPDRRAAAMAAVAVDIEAAQAGTAARRAQIPAMVFPDNLPVSRMRGEIAEAISTHQVVVVAGETGSGKTTQLPKICLELGRGVTGLIGHTQPRRLAARTVAERIAEETGTELGSLVGYQVRFTDRVSQNTAVKLMTDGILLTELQRDRRLLRYDTLIIDEAHERSLNIDFILGYLRQLLPQRRDLKVIITSATIDPQRFAEHFTLPGAKSVPVLEVSGRTYPVEVRYRPLDESADDDGDEDADTSQGTREPLDVIDGICAAVDELAAAGPGDILVFCSGEREIRDAADALRGSAPPHTEIVPLYARLSIAEQHRAFSPLPAGYLRRVVLATNVAETSLTVPGIRYVVDPGTARISRYSVRTKVQRLPIEPISQASANQRAGRCGRVADGICIRLYSQEDYTLRPQFTDPEILRTNLASVILQMASIGLGDVASFPFLDPPDPRAINDGVALLRELNAIADATKPDPARPQPGSPRPGKHRGRAPREHSRTNDEHSGYRLTDLGRRLAQLPVDPRMARMILAGDEAGCGREVIVIAAALSIQDVRERPTEFRAQADQLHARFADPNSDFMSYLNLWVYLRDQAKELSGNQFRKMCRREYLNYLRVREWQDLVGQLRQISRGVGITLPAQGSPPADPDTVHRALLAGLLSHAGRREGTKQEFEGARGTKFVLWPGSALARKPPHWVMAAELVETSRLFGRTVARIDPAWIEPLAGNLLKHQYSEPHWSSKRAAVMAHERVTLYGLPVITQRLVGYGSIDPEMSRELFIRHALVEGDWRTHHKFFHANRELLADAEDLEHRFRRRDLVADEDTLFDFYDARIPPDVVSGRHFDAWWKRARHKTPDLLTLTEDVLWADGAGLDPRAFPTHWPVEGGELDLSYHFDPSAPDDGVSITIPVSLLPGLDRQVFTWQVPGLREELITALIRSLPKSLRTSFVPAPDTAREVFARTDPGPLRPGVPAGGVLDAIEPVLEARAGVQIPRDAWDWSRVPAHLTMTFIVVDPSGTKPGQPPREVARGKDLEAIRARLSSSVRKAVAAIAGAGVERDRVDADFATLPEKVEQSSAQGTVAGYPALVDDHGVAAVRVLPTEADAQRAMWAGTRRLILDQVPQAVGRVQGQVDHVLTTPERLGLASSPYSSTSALLADVVAASIDQLVAANGGPVRDGESFAELSAAVRDGLDAAALELVRVTSKVLTSWRELDQRITSTRSLPMLGLIRDVREQVDSLIFDGFIRSFGAARMPDLIRYLRGVQMRLDRAPENLPADASRMQRLHALTSDVDAVIAALPPSRRADADVTDLFWMLQELRLSYFAQGVRTAYPISEQRIDRALDALEQSIS